LIQTFSTTIGSSFEMYYGEKIALFGTYRVQQEKQSRENLLWEVTTLIGYNNGISMPNN